MGAELLAKMVPAIEKMNWPSNPTINEVSLRAYEFALDEVDSYQGDPKTLQKPLQMLQGNGSQPLALAGIAYLILVVAEERDGSHAIEGLEKAMQWLEQAQEIEPERVEINFIEALVYIYSEQYDNARLVLDYLHEQTRHYYRLMAAEAIYARAIGDIEGLREWVEAAGREAANVPQRLRLISWVADAYVEVGQLNEAIEEYKKAIHFNRENGLLWHKLSIIFWRLEQYEEAQRCNQQVLRLKANIPAARKMAEALEKKLGGDKKSGLGRLFNR